jgi:CRP/FNR family transcriptional activator FtrB
MKPGLQTLADLPWFTAFSPGQLAALHDLADLARVGEQETLLRVGEPPGELTILLSGFVAETQTLRNTDAVVNIIAPVALIGLAPAVLDAVSPISAHTITAARLLVFPAQPLRALLRADPALALPFLHHALAALQGTTQDLCAMKLQSATQRLAAFLLDLAPDPDMSPARFVLPYEKRFIAARIGCSQENLSRAFATLRDIGVETQRGVVVLRDLVRLRRFAQS